MTKETKRIIKKLYKDSQKLKMIVPDDLKDYDYCNHSAQDERMSIVSTKV